MSLPPTTPVRGSLTRVAWHPAAHSSQTANVNLINQSIPAMVQSKQAAGKHVMSVDLNTGFDTKTMLSSDTIHPNQTGYDWMRYLRWYRGIADLTIRNEVEVVGIAPSGSVLTVSTKGALGNTAVLARRVVIATGHDGGGLWAVPDMVSEGLPPDVYAHSNWRSTLPDWPGGASAFSAMAARLSMRGSRRCKPVRRQSTSASGARGCRSSTRIAGWNGLPSWPITASSMTARGGMSGAISISKTSRRHATLSTAPAPSRVLEFTVIALGARLRGTEQKSR